MSKTLYAVLGLARAQATDNCGYTRDESENEGVATNPNMLQLENRDDQCNSVCQTPVRNSNRDRQKALLWGKIATYTRHSTNDDKGSCGYPSQRLCQCARIGCTMPKASLDRNGIILCLCLRTASPQPRPTCSLEGKLWAHRSCEGDVCPQSRCLCTRNIPVLSDGTASG
jgi:hypothetical protein